MSWLTDYSIRFYLSERFRLRFEDAGLEEIMDEDGEISAESVEAIADATSADAKSAPLDEVVDAGDQQADVSNAASNPFLDGQIRTLNGEIADDEYAADAINYQILLEKIEGLLEKLKLDA